MKKGFFLAIKGHGESQGRGPYALEIESEAETVKLEDPPCGSEESSLALHGRLRAASAKVESGDSRRVKSVKRTES